MREEMKELTDAERRRRVEHLEYMIGSEGWKYFCSIIEAKGTVLVNELVSSLKLDVDTTTADFVKKVRLSVYTELMSLPATIIATEKELLSPNEEDR